MQTHLPIMKTSGLIDYNEQTGLLHLLEFPPEIKCHLEVVQKGDIPWGTYYFALSIFGLVVSAIFNNLFAVILMTAFAIASAVQALQSYWFPLLRKRKLKITEQEN